MLEKNSRFYCFFLNKVIEKLTVVFDQLEDGDDSRDSFSLLLVARKPLVGKP